MTEPTTAIAKKEMIERVSLDVRGFTERGELSFPPDYAPENALKSAWLAIQDVKDRNKRPALEVVKPASVYKALLSMTIQGLNVDKKQGAFIVRGDQLVFQREYFGAMAVTKRVDPSIVDINPQVVYEGDEFEYGFVRGYKQVTKHVQKINNVDKTKIVAAYVTIVRGDGREDASEIMTIDEIKQAWKQSDMNPVLDNGSLKESSTHYKHTAAMAMKTVINRACKTIINASDDSDLLIRAFKASDQDVAEATAQEALDSHANTGDVIAAPEPEPDYIDVVDEGEYVEAPASFPDDPAGIAGPGF